ncbi:MAG: hypothetical protein M1832_004632 [Thelocarpon impressellum]|nr:MAG: hypothetical protein M1832_004632 [Thelocarpon impressellum]
MASPVLDHKVAWDYEKTLLLRLTVDKNGMLQESDIHFEVLQEYSAGARGERIILGHIKLNLAEYVDSDAEGEEGITRRYLMQESKINSTLKISITMKQTEGERNFFTPSLKSAPVFGGIAGIMSTEQTEQDDIGHLPTVNSKTRENGEMQDMYRRTLASSWAVQAGELPADECVESIFAGGSGWREARQGHAHRHDDDESGSTSEATSTSRRSSAHTHRRQKSSGSGSTVKTRASSNIGSGSTARNSITQRSGRSDDAESGSSTSGHVQGKKSAHKRGVGHGQGDVREVDEFDVREDLRSWRLPEMN